MRGEDARDGVERVDALAQPGAAGLPDTDDRQAVRDRVVGHRSDGAAAVHAQRPALAQRVGGERHDVGAPDAAGGHDDAVHNLQHLPVVQQRHEALGNRGRSLADECRRHPLSPGSDCHPRGAGEADRHVVVLWSLVEIRARPQCQWGRGNGAQWAFPQ